MDIRHSSPLSLALVRPFLTKINVPVRETRRVITEEVWQTVFTPGRSSIQFGEKETETSTRDANGATAGRS